MDIVAALKALVSPKRLPQEGHFVGWAGGITGATVARGSQMEQLTASSWLFACVERISSAVAATQWELYEWRGKERRMIMDHPLLDLWNQVNPFYSREEFLEVSQQHMELTGETWWVLLRNRAGVPVELWPVRPDRMSPVPDAQKHIAGYEYRVGGGKILLAPEDVIFVRRPHPSDPYRGLGMVESIYQDLLADRYAAQWVANFFKNAAEPGGIIQFDESLPRATFDELRMRWQEQHQGVGNAHRVAVIERGKWVERSYSQRDMQFAELRRVHRDNILGAFGIPKSVLGITEDVNRANAEAGELTFTRWVLLPRLRRIRAAVNERLCPLWGPNLVMEFVDPTPANRELDLAIAERAYNAGILTQNEARSRLGESAVAEGDTFRTPVAAPFGLGLGRAMLAQGRPSGQIRAPAVRDAQQRMQVAWGKRLKLEVESLIEYLGQFEPHPTLTKQIEPGSADGYDWDWWTKYGDEVVAELEAAFAAALETAGPVEAQRWKDSGPEEVQRRAAAYARARGARLLQLDGDLNLAQLTRARVNELIAQTLEEGESLGSLAKALRGDFAFSRDRAEMVSRTESSTALGQGAKEVAVSQGRDEKSWITQGDNLVSDECRGNEAAGWIGIGDAFPSGMDTTPQHPNCLIGLSRVSAQGISGVSKRWYQGQVVILGTASGHQLTCSPNHPILTPEGWIAAGRLNEGGYVVSSRSRKWMNRGDVDYQDMPPSIEEVADTLLKAGGMASVPVPLSAEDFHGDGVGSQVAIIGSDSLLWATRDTPVNQRSGHQHFQGRGVKALALDGGGLPHQGFPASGHAPGGYVSRRHLMTALSSGHARPFQGLGGALGTKLSASIAEISGNSGTAYAIPLGEDIYRIAGEVFADKLVQVRRLPFSGHIYNLETLDAFYVAESIITHNCRCNVRYRTAALAVPQEAIGANYCPTCKKLLMLSKNLGKLYCRRCKKEV